MKEIIENLKLIQSGLNHLTVESLPGNVCRLYDMQHLLDGTIQLTEAIQAAIQEQEAQKNVHEDTDA